MTRLGYWLIAVAFVAGAWTTVVHPTEVDWAWFAPVVSVGFIGVALARRGEKAEAEDSDRVESDLTAAVAALATVTQRADELAQRAEELNPYDVHGEIDRLFPDELGAFVDARKSIAHRHGLTAYATVMSEFAAGERTLNRVWSASVDGYVDEVRTYLGRSAERFRAAEEALAKLQG